MSASLRIGVIGHVEHITLGRIAGMPSAGDIVHLGEPRVLVGGGGGIALFQLARSDAEVHFFTALGDDDGATFVEHAIASTTRVTLHAVRRQLPQTRDIVMIDPQGERTIIVVGEPLHPRADDPLPWDLLSAFDAVFFTGQDPALLALARHARVLVVPARRRHAIVAARVPIDVIVGSRVDPREVSTLADYAIPPTALVMTDGARGGIVETRDGVTPFRSPTVTQALGTYGAGDSFAGALTYYVGSGLSPAVAAERAAHHGAAVVASLDPLAAQLPLPYEPVR